MFVYCTSKYNQKDVKGSIEPLELKKKKKKSYSKRTSPISKYSTPTVYAFSL